jgi:hypothetical protein
MELEFKQRYERQAVPNSLALQSDIIELSRSLPQQVEVENSLLKRLLSRVAEYARAAKQPVFAGALASVLVVSGCVFLLKTVVFNEQVNQTDYSVGVLIDRPNLVGEASLDSTNDFSVSDYDWQEVMLLEDEFLLASL